jgi:hypothetical protein
VGEFHVDQGVVPRLGPLMHWRNSEDRARVLDGVLEHLLHLVVVGNRGIGFQEISKRFYFMCFLYVSFPETSILLRRK